jgi:hypothetical protein
MNCLIDKFHDDLVKVLVVIKQMLCILPCNTYSLIYIKFFSICKISEILLFSKNPASEQTLPTHKKDKNINL